MKGSERVNVEVGDGTGSMQGMLQSEIGYSSCAVAHEGAGGMVDRRCSVQYQVLV